MSNDDGSLWICYNGEVYGWQDEARKLAASGVNFRTHSDTEFILRAYEAWGLEPTLNRLRGMFAFAIYDARVGKVYLARDRMGKKPLVYHATSGCFAFASTVRALLPNLPPAARRFSPEAIDAYLAHRTIPAPLTSIADARRLPNGHYVEYDLATENLRETNYWQPTPQPGDWLAVLDDAIALRTIADRPVGLFLSGGIDSAVLAARLSATGHPLVAYTAAFPGTAFDESPFAARVAQRFGLEHRTISVPTAIRDDFSRLVADLDEPFADPSAIPLWYLAREATKEVKVVLAGDGGDELFAGYKRYAKHLRSAWRRGLRWPLRNWPTDMEPTAWRKLRLELSMSWYDAYSLRFSGFTPSQRHALQPQLLPLPAVRWRHPEAKSSPLETLLAIDMANYLPEYILRKADLASMAHGLELRAPLLDTQFYETILAQPPARRFTTPAKQLMAPALPADLATELFSAKKRGFNPPLENWLQQDLAERWDGLGTRLQNLTDGQLDANAVDTFIGRYRNGVGAMAERALQLLILDESLGQLATV